MGGGHQGWSVDEWNERGAGQWRGARRWSAGAFLLVGAVLAALATGCGSTAGPTPPPEPRPSAILGPFTPGVFDHAFVDVRTGSVTPMPHGIEGGYSYRRSPDGSMFAFESCCGEFFVASIDGSGLRQITPHRLDAQGAAWSPDGSSLVFQGRRGGDRIGDLFVVDVATGSLRRVTDLEPRRSGWWFMWPSFSPDGRSILFHLPRRHPDPTTWDLWSVPLTGGRSTIVRRDVGMGQYSPNGRTIAYLPSLDPRNATGGSIRLMDMTGESRMLVEDRGIWWPRWSPDGTRIAYAAENHEIHVVDVATGRVRTVGDGGVAEWFDDHTLIVGPGGEHS